MDTGSGQCHSGQSGCRSEKIPLKDSCSWQPDSSTASRPATLSHAARQLPPRRITASCITPFHHIQPTDTAMDPNAPPSPRSRSRVERAIESNKRINSFQQMMYVSGETGESSVETTSIIEDIVRQQVIELVWPHAPRLG